ncbi:CRISPR-associated endoribonuclease Cas6 [Ammonifex thiophilus]|uniref:CRISPR-associated endoribonuclease Cas6 n=1 Tax=Ammonifex thiophilus TaxID=444093 RepID=UPI00196B5530|nr:CRISPR-associated endoribonuclease Cas6 [Ammonifex thiophilus]
MSSLIRGEEGASCSRGTTSISCRATLTLEVGGEVALGSVRLKVEEVKEEPPPDFSGPVLCETMSPVVVSTGIRKGAKLHKRFLPPEDPAFWYIAEQNLRRKAAALNLDLPAGATVRFERVGDWRSRLVEVQGLKVRGYEGRFVAEGNWRLLLLAYEAGLGERNSQGFGMFRIVSGYSR